MSSSVHSPSSTSSDVVLAPHPLNHVNHNHTESSSTTKTLKRNRSPSLTRDDNNETNDSITTTNTPSKKSRKKRNTTDIDQSLGLHLSADKLHIYQWPIDEPHADLHILQEQICDYLSLKSFKRKYPDIYRRIVDLHEREYLKAQHVVTETQCDLGLTALKLDEVLQLMSIDYPEKCHGASSDEEDEVTTTTRLPISTSQSPLLVNGIGSNGPSSVRLTKPSTPISMNSHANLCHMCKTADDENDEEFVTCTSCHHRYHPVCLDVNAEMLTIIKTYPWQCIDCKSCAKCNTTHDEANMMFCDRCDRGYHSYCAGLEAIPDGSWQCSACDPPAPPPPPPSTSPAPITKGKRGRPSSTNRSSPRQQPATSPKSELVPTRVSSRRSHKILSTPLSPSNNISHSSNSSSADVQSNTNSPSVNLILSRHQQQWTTTTSNNNNNNTITSTNQR
ncbi:unnamed protein product [Rotaria magnacalcarata]|uniref:PHD-type domain-containing protein n=1 Tax=Rotaria magnacalcarata TaxID=392030 RepID=A0A8S2V1N5_9BILA|nr:unnamed protein product [Rotaria magnacalcarata]CAF4366473.1 unnamed protein product [Rotaria magnacalcarata]